MLGGGQINSPDQGIGFTADGSIQKQDNGIFDLVSMRPSNVTYTSKGSLVTSQPRKGGLLVRPDFLI